MLSTVGTGFLRDMSARNIIESQEEISKKEAENGGSRLRKFSDDEFFARKLRLSINTTIKTNTLYQQNNNHEMLGFNVMHEKIESIHTTLSSFTEILNTYKISEGDDEGLRQKASFMLRSVINDLNSEWNGRYLFASEKSNVKPVDEDFINTDTSLTFSIEDGLLDYSYYNGGLDKVQLQLTRTLTTSYELHAGDMNFAFVLNTMNAFINKQIDRESVDIFQSYLMEVSKGLDGLMSKVDSINSSINGALGALEEENRAMAEIIQDNKNFDVLKLYSDLVDRVRNLTSSLEMNKNIDKARWGTSN